jgi:hypothetical protein
MRKICSDNRDHLCCSHLDPQDRALPPLPTISSLGISTQDEPHLAAIAKRFSALALSVSATLSELRLLSEVKRPSMLRCGNTCH